MHRTTIRTNSCRVDGHNAKSMQEIAADEGKNSNETS